MSRSFRIVDVSTESSADFANGVYHGDTPRIAARKAFSMFCRKVRKGIACRQRFEIQEITRGSARKVYAYVGSRRLLDAPYQIMRDGKLVTIKYTTTIRKAAK